MELNAILQISEMMFTTSTNFNLLKNGLEVIEQHLNIHQWFIMFEPQAGLESDGETAVHLADISEW